MDLIKLLIPTSFVTVRVPLSWQEALFGLDSELLDPSTLDDLALLQIAAVDKPSIELTELAAGASTPCELVQHLAGREPVTPEHEIRDKWLFTHLRRKSTRAFSECAQADRSSFEEDRRVRFDRGGRVECSAMRSADRFATTTPNRPQ